MTKREELLALAEWCEAATGPDREIELAIWRLTDLGAPEVEEAGKVPLPWLKNYTASLDAAVTLVPEGCLFTARTVWDKGKQAGLGFVSRYEKGEFGGHERLYWMDEHQAVAATPALALTAAALRARAAME